MTDIEKWKEFLLSYGISFDLGVLSDLPFIHIVSGDSVEVFYAGAFIWFNSDKSFSHIEISD